MASTAPFIDPETGGLDTDQIRAEAFPIAGIVMLFVGLALLPFVLAVTIAGSSFFGLLFTLLAQFVLAVGAGVVLIYVIARGIQLADG